MEALRRMHRTLTRSFAGGLALALLFTACSDDGDDEGSDDTTTTEAQESTTTAAEEPTTTAADDDEDDTSTTEADDSGDEGEGDPDAIALAESINLTIDDFAPGWEAEPSEDDGPGSFNDCFVENPIRELSTGRAESPTFSIDASPESGQLVTMQTVVFDSPETAETITAEAQGDAFATCTTDGLVGNLGDGAEGQLELVVDDPQVTDESFGLAGAVSIPSDAGSSQGLIDVHVFRTQNVISFVATVDIGETGEFESTLTGLYATIADRHAANVQ